MLTDNSMVDRPVHPTSKPHGQNQSVAKGLVQKARKILWKKQKRRVTSALPHPKLKKKATPARTKDRLLSTLAIAILLSSAGLIVVFTWISIELILDPDAVTWLNQLLPGWVKSLNYQQHSQSLKEIKINLEKQGLTAGEFLSLESKNTAETFVLPVLGQGKNIVELRVYQRSSNPEVKSQPEKYYNLTAQLPVSGLEESFVLAPLLDAGLDRQTVNKILPVTAARRFETQTPSPGYWFYLQGKIEAGTEAIAYGHVFHYNPERTHLQLMLSWTSPSGRPPQWRQVINAGAQELVVDQTVGFEPRLRIYEVKPVKFVLHPIQLEEVSLEPSLLKDSAYQNALLFARSGLWTPALQSLQSLVQQHQGKIPQTVKTQIDYIRLHSQLTKAQADKIWASPSQQVLADLIDGRWQKALQIFAASVPNVQEINSLLRMDSQRLWTRVEAALQVNPHQPQVQAWAALILAARYGQERANSFLQQQSKMSPQSLAYIQSLLAQQSRVTSAGPSRIVGSVKAIASVNPAQWSLFNSKTLPNTQAWYQIEVTAFHDGQRWVFPPFANFHDSPVSFTKSFWESLGLSFDPTIDIVVWLANGQQQVIAATVKAVQFQKGILRLLAASDENIPQVTDPDTQPPPLALTAAALEWVQPNPISLQQLYQQNQLLVKTILPTVWRTLQASGQLPPAKIPNLSQMLQKLGSWPVQQIDLTGNGEPETVLTISAEAIQSLYPSQDPPQLPSRPRTLIFSDSGRLIYTDFGPNSRQFLTAIAKLATVNSLALLVEDGNFYKLKRWSEQNQRFE